MNIIDIQTGKLINSLDVASASVLVKGDEYYNPIFSTQVIGTFRGFPFLACATADPGWLVAIWTPSYGLVADRYVTSEAIEQVQGGWSMVLSGMQELIWLDAEESGRKESKPFDRF